MTRKRLVRDEIKSTSSPQPPSPIERSEAQPSSPPAADAERRIAQLESEKGALAAEVSRLQQQASSDEQASAPRPRLRLPRPDDPTLCPPRQPRTRSAVSPSSGAKMRRSLPK